MRALTITQPWAGLIAAGIKRIENRSRPLIKREDFGKPFAIHASREIDEAVYARVEQIQPGLCCGADVSGGPNSCAPSIGDWWPLSRITSAVIAVATVERCVVEWDADEPGRIVDAAGVNGAPVVDLGDQHRWFFGPIGYVLRDIRALASPVPCRGKLGFWHLSAEVERQVVEQIA